MSLFGKAKDVPIVNPSNNLQSGVSSSAAQVPAYLQGGLSAGMGQLNATPSNVAISSMYDQKLAEAKYNAKIVPPWEQLKSRKYKYTTISLEDTSNGTIIRIGDIVRVCPADGVLFDQVAAAFTEHKLSENP